VRATSVTKRWGLTTALDAATLEFGRGVTGLLGANGAGKTTLLGLMLGLHTADAGRLEVLGLDPAEAGPDVRARLGYSPELHVLPPDMRAHDLVRHIAEVHGLPRRQATGQASDTLWQVGLGEERYRPIGTMSTGQKQRVKLAQAIVHDPALVLLDEPTDGLDPVQREDMLGLIRRIGTEFGIDVILSSHLLDEVERVCDAAVILAAGQVVASGTLDELRGTGRGVVVEVDDGIEEVARMLRAAGAEVTEDGSRLLVAGDGEGLYDVVRDVVAESGVGLRRLHPGTVTLEEVFLGTGVPAPGAPEPPSGEGMG
jgi:ABC-2 type transport system ATP-binding protein